MIYKLDCSKYSLLDDDIKKLSKFIQEEFGIANVYRIEGDYEQIDIYAYDNFDLKVKNADGSFTD